MLIFYRIWCLTVKRLSVHEALKDELYTRDFKQILHHAILEIVGLGLGIGHYDVSVACGA